MVFMEMIRGYFVVEIDTFWIAVGLAALGYFKGDGLKNFSKPQKNQVILI
jgi:hypothetical protein